MLVSLCCVLMTYGITDSSRSHSGPGPGPGPGPALAAGLTLTPQLGALFSRCIQGRA
jgi:hypothetical protein